MMFGNGVKSNENEWRIMLGGSLTSSPSRICDSVICRTFYYIFVTCPSALGLFLPNAYSSPLCTSDILNTMADPLTMFIVIRKDLIKVISLVDPCVCESSGEPILIH